MQTMLTFLSVFLLNQLSQNILVSGGYNLVTSYAGNNFFSGFNFQTSNAGYTQYLTEAQAQNLSIISVNASTNQVYVGVDYTTIIQPGYKGRPTVYLRSKTLYNEGLFIYSLDHMPQGCGVMPQFWFEGVRWPSNGEIKIMTCTNTINGTVADIMGNTPCTFTNNANNFNFTGKMDTTNCQGGNGCMITNDNLNSCNFEYNLNFGGYHAVQWVKSNSSDGGIKIWFWNKNGNNIPKDISSNSQTPDPSTFGEPFAAWKFGSWCNDGLVYNQTITIDLQFCGYAGQVFVSQGCDKVTGYTNCEGYVANNPQKFKDVYWLIDYINVYQQQ